MQLGRTRFPLGMIAAYVLGLGAILAWPFVAFGAAFAFDSPMTPAQTQSTEAVVGLVLAYPIIPIVGVLGSVLAQRAGRSRLAWGLAAIALIPTAFLVLVLAASFVMNILFALGVKF